MHMVKEYTKVNYDIARLRPISFTSSSIITWFCLTVREYLKAIGLIFVISSIV